MITPEEDIEIVDLAADLMIPTEVKEIPVVKTEQKNDSTANRNSEGSKKSEPGSNSSGEEKVALSQIISPEESAENLVLGIEAILGLTGGAFYAIKAYNILNAEEKKLLKIAKSKKPSDRSDDEVFLIDRFEAEKVRLEEKSQSVDLTDPEVAKLKKSAKAFVKTKNLKIGGEVAFYIALADIISDRVIDAFMD